ncbi:MAG TPA: 1-acyl-sn-glycerol-3-phosphate acyltransferase [Candidatus Accumulibacter phosphatis]|nr:MAG: 1-acylglycerol-3-phosphate O-acyltransferase [Candidatus Accumulibacter sp. SK-11]HAY27674.1 glycerol acyltransferase [Accumulibacter sp.]HCN69058.1 glycerol acyltransferase [Accumulibacter sp.]HRL78208.1 1-acyl-sn-glycerol-3-phosphate acyltransferase [Candidatus Accumulibacter phosphatis]HRQ97213.1 1-acyl-sn-glycerol-3-phosphate acyltransferase [Candidatus Accumulibacter phosphatis]
MLKNLASRLLALHGWTLSEPPDRPERAVLIAYPHTSNWDALYALLAKLGLGLDARWVAKDTLFRWPFGGLLGRMGGIPINRRVRCGLVSEMVAQFAAQPRLLLVVAPEGTRRLTDGWKSGFYRIALAANVPLALGFVDYARRQAGILAYLRLTGDPEIDIAAIARHYADRPGKHPTLASPIRWLD